MTTRGTFITLEGLDGCGKSTQLDLLAAALRRAGHEVVLTREPGGTEIGLRIREILLANTSAGLSPLAELMLYAADRAQHVTQVVRPAIEAGRVVISDRHTDSTVAFQGYGRGLDLAAIAQLNGLATGGLKPDLTIVFDVSWEQARQRLDARLSRSDESGMTRFEDEARDFHGRVREGYLELARLEPGRVRLLDASHEVNVVHSDVMNLVLEILAGAAGTATR